MATGKKRIRMLTTVAGGCNYAAGRVVDADAWLADELVRAGHAEFVTATPQQTAEKAVSQRAAKAEKRTK